MSELKLNLSRVPRINDGADGYNFSAAAFRLTFCGAVVGHVAHLSTYNKWLHEPQRWRGDCGTLPPQCTLSHPNAPGTSRAYRNHRLQHVRAAHPIGGRILHEADRCCDADAQKTARSRHGLVESVGACWVVLNRAEDTNHAAVDKGRRAAAHTHNCARPRTHTNAHVGKHMHARTPARPTARTQARTHARTHTHTHTHR